MTKGRIIVVRHGNTPYNTAQVFQPLDSHLSPLGWQQAQRVGERLASGEDQLKVVKILTSDLPRTKQTTSCISSSLPQPVPVVESALLRERDFGGLVGRSIYDAPRDLFRQATVPHFSPEGAESWHVFFSRVDDAWAWVVEQAQACLVEDDECVVVVTHGLVKSRLATLWGWQERVHFENTSVSVVRAALPHDIHVLNCHRHLRSGEEGSGGGESKL